MAIQNASDLLVYAKTTSAVAQVTRIRVLNVDPITLTDGETTGRVDLNNLTNVNGQVYDAQSTGGAANTGTSLMGQIVTKLGNYSYSNNGSTITEGDYVYRDFTNGAVGLVPTIEIVDGSTAPKATLNEGAVIIEVLTPGSSATFDPVAFSTSASFSSNLDYRDITNKDSNGWSESLGGLRSFEVSTDILQSINPDVPLDGTDFFDKLKNRSLVDLSFSDRRRNLILTDLTQTGVDGFSSIDISQSNIQSDALGGNKASYLLTTTADFDRLRYKAQLSTTSGSGIPYARFENKPLTWSFYVKGKSGTNANTTATWTVLTHSSAVNTITANSGSYEDEIVSGQGTIADGPVSGTRKITGLSTSTWTRIAVSFTEPLHLENGDNEIEFALYPGLSDDQTGDALYTCFWQLEQTPYVTNYQNPSDITHWQGYALVSSLSFDAGVEDNLTCSATFTGTGNVYPNGLGPELIEDTGFNLGTVGITTGAYWSANNTGAGATSVIENGYGKIITDGTNTDINRAGLMTAGDTYVLVLTIHTSTAGTISVIDGWHSTDVVIPDEVGTHTLLLRPSVTKLALKRISGSTTIWMSSISLKKVL